MLDRIRGYSDILVGQIAAKPALYTRMRAFVRTKVLVSDSCRTTYSTTGDKPSKRRDVLALYNRVYDRANLGDENAKRLLIDIACVTGINIRLGDEVFGPEKYVPVAKAA